MCFSFIYENHDEAEFLYLLSPLSRVIGYIINDYLEEMAKTIYDYWFIQFDFPGENGKPYKSSGGKMSFCNELNREIPQNWNYTSIGNITICLDSERIPLSNQFLIMVPRA